MAILLELENSDEESSSDLKSRWLRETLAMRDRNGAPGASSALSRPAAEEPQQANEDGPNPNRGGFSAALSCYPIVSALAPHLDLNSLASLAGTCRQFRANLLPFRAQLVAQSLRCINDEVEIRDKLGERLRESAAMLGQGISGARRKWEDEGLGLTSGRVGRCARDLVAECRRCGNAVCRNCISKPPPARYLSSRHRRLCRTCLEKPYSYHTNPSTGPALRPRSSSHGANGSTPDLVHGNEMLVEPQPSSDSIPTLSKIYAESDAFTAPAFEHTPCSCATKGVWICMACTRGSNLIQSDTTYVRGWTWRTRYAARLSGNGNGSLGNGVGEGVEGVECGRRGGCAAAKHLEVEEEIRAPLHASSHLWNLGGSSSAGDQGGFEAEGEQETEWERDREEGEDEAGYNTQEIQGVGGTVMRKIKRRVLVGAAVGDLEDDVVGMGTSEEPGDHSQPLWEEREGRTRSWCAWCCRVIPSRTDLESTEKGKRQNGKMKESGG